MSEADDKVDDKSDVTSEIVAVDEDFDLEAADDSQYAAFDREDPRSVINLVPGAWRKIIERIPREWLSMSERELEAFVRPEPFVSRLRLAFWAEYEVAQMRVEKMSIHRMAMRLGVGAHYVSSAMRGTENMAWVLCVPGSYEMYLDEAVNYGLRRLREEVLTMNITKDNGAVDPKAAELLLKAIAFLDMRKHGGFVQRSEVANVKRLTDSSEPSMMSVEEIDEKIANLEKAVGKKLNPKEMLKEIELGEKDYREVTKKVLE